MVKKCLYTVDYLRTDAGSEVPLSGSCVGEWM